MPDVAPFKGIRYDAGAVDLSAVTAPPYDVISPAERTQLESASPFNVVRLILGPLGSETGKYSLARALLDDWLQREILVCDDAPALYIYEERFQVAGRRRRQVGVLAAVQISDDILPHERTMAPVVEDRLELIRAVEANLSPVFCLYWASDDAATLAIAEGMKGEPDADFATTDGLGHRAWRMTDPGQIQAVAKALGDARVVIADGHHRYRTAQAYRDERRASDGPGPWDRMLLYLVDAERDAPALLPIHRLVSGIDLPAAIDRLQPLFDLETFVGDADALAAVLADRKSGGRCYGLVSSQESWIATLRDEEAATVATAGEHSQAWRDLDVAVLHELIFDRLLAGPSVTYVHHPGEAAQELAAGRASFAVLLAPMPVDAVRAVAEAHDSMPPKSTFFIPKPRTGIVIRPLGK